MPMAANVLSAVAVVSRTGYTGEDGFELIVAASEAVRIWEALLDSGPIAGSSPAGSGPATRSASRRRCRSTVTRWRRRSTRLPPGWAGPSSSTRESSSAARRCGQFKAEPGTGPGRPAPSRAKRIARQGCPVLRDGRARRRGHLGDLRPDPRREPGDGAGRPGRLGARDRADGRRSRPREPARVTSLPFYRRKRPFLRPTFRRPEDQDCS